MRLWLVTFFTEDGDMTGGVIVRAASFLSALLAINGLGIHPDGPAMDNELPYGSVNEEWMNRWLTPAEISTVLEQVETT